VLEYREVGSTGGEDAYRAGTGRAPSEARPRRPASCIGTTRDTRDVGCREGELGRATSLGRRARHTRRTRAPSGGYGESTQARSQTRLVGPARSLNSSRGLTLDGVQLRSGLGRCERSDPLILTGRPRLPTRPLACLLDARAQAQLRAVRQGLAARCGQRADLHVRVHVLRGVRRARSARRVPELRRRLREATSPSP